MTLVAWHSITPWESPDLLPESADPEYDLAMTMINDMVNGKQGKPFKSISIKVEDGDEEIREVMDCVTFSVVIEGGIIVETGEKREN